MPELAEVEFYRKQWNAGLNQRVFRVHLNEKKRVFRGLETPLLKEKINGAFLRGSQAHGKQMLFRFSGKAWLGVHLGMSGKLRVEKNDFTPMPHDHLVLFQAKQALVFSDPRQFGRILFSSEKYEPQWWRDLPPSLDSEKYTVQSLQEFLKRHSRAPIKAVLLLQSGFPGI